MPLFQFFPRPTAHRRLPHLLAWALVGGDRDQRDRMTWIHRTPVAFPAIGAPPPASLDEPPIDPAGPPLRPPPPPKVTRQHARLAAAILSTSHPDAAFRGWWEERGAGASASGGYSTVVTVST